MEGIISKRKKKPWLSTALEKIEVKSKEIRTVNNHKLPLISISQKQILSKNQSKIDRTKPLLEYFPNRKPIKLNSNRNSSITTSQRQNDSPKLLSFNAKPLRTEVSKPSSLERNFKRVMVEYNFHYSEFKP